MSTPLLSLLHKATDEKDLDAAMEIITRVMLFAGVAHQMITDIGRVADGLSDQSIVDCARLYTKLYRTLLNDGDYREEAELSALFVKGHEEKLRAKGEIPEVELKAAASIQEQIAILREWIVKNKRGNPSN